MRVLLLIGLFVVGNLSVTFATDFEHPTPGYKACFDKDFNIVKDSPEERKEFFKNLHKTCHKPNTVDLYYIVKSCVINGYLETLQKENKNNNLEKTIEIAKMTIITDCETYIKEFNTISTQKDKDMLLKIIDKTTDYAIKLGLIK